MAQRIIFKQRWWIAERIKPKKNRVTKKAPPKKSSFLTKNLEHRISKAEGAFYGYVAPLFRRKEVPIRSKVLITSAGAKNFVRPRVIARSRYREELELMYVGN